MSKRDEVEQLLKQMIEEADSLGGMTQHEIAREIGLSRNSVVKIEKRAFEKLKHLLAIKYGIEKDDLF